MNGMEERGSSPAGASSPAGDLRNLQRSKAVSIEFERLRVSVPVKGPNKRDAGQDRKLILKGVSGKLQPARLLAMMGSSGA